MFDPAGSVEVLGELLIATGDDLGLLVDDQRGDAGRSGIQREDYGFFAAHIAYPAA